MCPWMACAASAPWPREGVVPSSLSSVVILSVWCKKILLGTHTGTVKRSCCSSLSVQHKHIVDGHDEFCELYISDQCWKQTIRSPSASSQCLPRSSLLMTQSEAFWLIGACCTFITREARITKIAGAVEQRHEIDSLRAQDAMIKTAANAMQQH